jgi:hypothetical protein
VRWAASFEQCLELGEELFDGVEALLYEQAIEYWQMSRQLREPINQP